MIKQDSFNLNIISVCIKIPFLNPFLFYLLSQGLSFNLGPDDSAPVANQLVLRDLSMS